MPAAFTRFPHVSSPGYEAHNSKNLTRRFFPQRWQRPSPVLIVPTYTYARRDGQAEWA